MMSFFSVPFFAAEKVDVIIEPGTAKLSELCVGYDDPSSLSITLFNNGSGKITVEEPKITNQETSFEIGSLSKTVLLPGETAKFNIAPKLGLTAGTYEQTLYVKVGSYKFSFAASIKINSHDAVYFESKAVTCTQNGYDGYWYCGNCGKRFSDKSCTKEVSSDDIVRESEGHQWNSEYTVDVAATCTSVGEKSIHCAKCDERTDIQEIPMAEHQYGDWVVVEEATCTQEGYMEKTCTECGAVESSTIPATGHKWEIVTEDEGSESIVHVVCAYCGEEKYSKDKNECQHQYGEWYTLIEPSCTSEGCEEHTCQLCGYCESRILDILPHNWEDDYTVDKKADSSSEGLKSIHCADCDAVKDETVIPKAENDEAPLEENNEDSDIVQDEIAGSNVDSPAVEEEAQVQEDNTKVLLSSFTTVITNTENARINMAVASASCNNSVILPGETWSFNSCTGDSNQPSNGYVLANVIANGQYTQGYGGGICQVSSTIYKAAVCANLEIVERHYHYWASDYTKAGFDATINYGNLDLRLRNTTDYPIYLECYTDGSTVTASFYGFKDDFYDSIATYSYNYSIDSDYFGTVSYRVYIKDGQELYREELPGSKYRLDEYHDVWPSDEGTICADKDQPERSFPVAKEPEDIGY